MSQENKDLQSSAIDQDDSASPEFLNGSQTTGQADKLIGTVFAQRYRILKIAGHGGMSTVYKAQHTYMERLVALKLLHSHLIRDPISIQRFQQEAIASSSLNHPNIISVHDFGVNEVDSLAFMVMDYLEGPSLGDIIDNGGPIAEVEALDLFRQICRGLIHAHHRGVVHRDLKPRNLIVESQEDGTVLVKIVDFGIAKIIPQEGLETQHLTQTGEVFGSPIYMSPEQCSGESLDERSDIYSLGCVMYEVLTGLPPFIGNNAVETMSMHIRERPPSFADTAPGMKISEHSEEIVMRCLEKKQSKRFQSARELLESLTQTSKARESTPQSETLALRLKSMAGTSDSLKQAPRRITRRRSSRLRISSRAVALTLACILAPIFLLSFVYQGPDEDPGSPAAKTYWQTLLTMSDWLIGLKAYSFTVPVLKQAHWLSENMDYLMRRPNYEKRMRTLMKLALVYSAMGEINNQEKLVDEFIELDVKRWALKADEYIDDLEEALEIIDELKSRGEPLQAHLSEPKLNWAGAIRPIIEVAKRNDTNHSYQIELDLLTKAEEVIRKLYGPDYVGLADLRLQRAQCLRAEDRIEEIDEERLYESAKELEEKYLHSLLGKPESEKLSAKEIAQSPRLIRKLVKLGQWQRDRGRMTEARPNLALAIEACELCTLIGASERAEIYSSYADFLTQVNEESASIQFKEKARKSRLEAQRIYLQNKQRGTDKNHIY